MTHSSTTNYKVITTGDESPTLALPETWEPMHSLEGAFSETVYIYQPVIEKALATSSPCVLSVGLGLGYNELLTVALMLKKGLTKTEIFSYEKEEFLITGFTKWLNREPTDLSSIYDLILERICKHLSIEAQSLRHLAQQLLEKESLKLLGPLEPETPLPKANALLFDAFSKKTSGSLWEKDYLDHFLTKTAGTPCWLSTYACTGDLYRLLVSHGFEAEKRKGFGKKRQSLFAAKLA